MKVKVLRPFYDEKEQTRREVGEEFECSQARFDQIKSVLPEWIEGTTTPKRAQTTSKKARK